MPSKKASAEASPASHVEQNDNMFAAGKTGSPGGVCLPLLSHALRGVRRGSPQIGSPVFPASEIIINASPACDNEEPHPLGPLGFEGAQHRQTLRPSSGRDPQQSPASFRSAVKDLEDPAVQCRT